MGNLERRQRRRGRRAKTFIEAVLEAFAGIFYVSEEAILPSIYFYSFALKNSACLPCLPQPVIVHLLNGSGQPTARGRHETLIVLHL